MPLKALIFDVDRTFANTERDAHLFVFNNALQQLGINWNWSNDLYHQPLLVTDGKKRIKYYINDKLKDFDVIPFADNIANFAAKLHRQKTQNFIDIINKGNLSLHIGIKNILYEAKNKNLRLAIVTTIMLENVKAIISNFSIQQWIDNFEAITTGDAVNSKKLADDVYTYVSNQMNLLSNEVFAFEDSENSIKSATKARLKTIITVDKYTKYHNFNDALVVPVHLGDSNNPFTVINGEKTHYKFGNN